MSTRVVERVDGWTEQSFSGGYRGLHDLADLEFSGVVRAGGAELFMTKGVVVGIRHGDIETFEDAEGTQYAAPTPALPLLAVMQERSDEVRAKYYTEETAISEVDRTLEDGGFTGFVELSENVLSGDYYLVYHRGRSMSVAFVGNQQRLIEDDEAFEQADGEVGIYEVRPVEIEAIEIPEPEEPEEPDPVAAAGTSAIDATEEASDDEPPGVEDDDEADSLDDGKADEEDVEDGPDAPEAEPADTATEETAPAAASESPESKTVETTSAESEPDETGTVVPSAPESEEDTADERTDGPEGGDEAVASDVSASDVSASEAHSQSRAAQTEVPGSEQRAAGQTGPPERQQRDRADAGDAGPGTAQASSDVAERETARASPVGSAADLETKAIPSLDPGMTETKDRGDSGGSRAAEAAGRREAKQARRGGTTARRERDRSQAEARQPDSSTARAQNESSESGEQAVTTEVEPAEATDASGDTETDERVEELEAELEQREERIEELETELDDAIAQRDDARANLASVQEERDELQAEVDRLRSELERLEEELGAATGAERRITPQEALTGTDLFVRYHSKGDGTLEKAHDSGIRREDFTENLRLEKHTQFDSAGAAVGGQTYDEFIETTVEYKFVQWVVRDLLFEIQSTGNTETLRDLYDALPEINRVELNGTVTATDEDNNETSETFDVVFRARMGDPLLVANINDSRQGATQTMMESLITAAERVGKTGDEFASAFLVTQSFFEPAALEAVAGATRGGILSRDKRKSFVNLSRKQGYHLCLVEARNENFHLEVPEL